MNATTLVQKIWNFCHTLRDDGVGYGDYLEQLTYLLFLKLAHEYAQPPYNRQTRIPKGYDWASLRSKTGEPLESHYLLTLHKLGSGPGMLGAIFFKAQNKIQDPAKLSRLVQLIDAENWISLDADTKGDLYEGLLQKNAEDTKSGAGQYFTPRAVIEAMVSCVRPEPMKTIADPACGTGGFFLGSYNSRFAYVSVSRASHDAQIYTNDAASLAEKLSHDVTKASAIDLGRRQAPIANVGLDQAAALKNTPAAVLV